MSVGAQVQTQRTNRRFMSSQRAVEARSAPRKLAGFALGIALLACAESPEPRAEAPLSTAKDALLTGLFPTADVYPVGNHVSDVAVGDFNGDGAPDVVVNDLPVGTNFNVFFNNGSGGLVGPTLVSAFNQGTRGVEVADFNGDGLDDIAAGTDVGVSVVISNGDGTFQPPLWPTNSSVDAWDIAVGDLNGDGWPDAVTIEDSPSPAVGVYLNNGGSAFLTPGVYWVGGTPAGVAVKDVNADGAPDVLVANYDHHLDVLLNLGDGALGAPTTYPTSGSAYRVTAGDLNGDGLPEVVVSNEAGGVFDVFLNLGGGALSGKLPYATPEGPAGVTLVDMNGDCRLDVVATTQYRGSVDLLMNDGSGDLLPGVEYAAGDNSTGVVSADMNGDLWPDLVVANNGGVDGIPSASVIMNQGDGRLRAARVYGLHVYARAVRLEDVNNDGHLDLIAGGSYPFSLQMSVHLNAGDGTFRAPTYYTPAGGYDIVPLDLDGDGWLDFVTSSAANSRLYAYRNQQDGTFTLLWQKIFNDPRFLASADFNGDGRADFAVSKGGNVRVFLNDGSGMFSAPPLFVDADALSFTAADVNGDAAADLVFASYMSAGQAGVAFGNGDGTFQPPVMYPVGPYPTSVIAGDLNGDTLTDVAVVNHDSGPPGSISILLNTGAGALAPAQGYAAGSKPFAFTGGDVDGDGDIDLAVTQLYATPTVVLLENDGGGSYSVAGGYYTGREGGFAAMGDVDGDGILDIAVSGDTSYRVAVLRSNDPPVPLPSPCATDSDCACALFCAASGHCAARKVLGSACDAAAGADCLDADCRVCASGHCTDGVCCDAACDGACDVCATSAGATKDGACSNASPGAPGAPSCAPYVCSGVSPACPSSCLTDADCGPSHYCSAQGACAPRKPKGAPCGFADCSAGGCASCEAGLTCRDGVCCGSLCDSACAMCAPATGICGPVLNAEDPDTCGGAAICDASGSCRKKNGQACLSSLDCASGHCADGICCDTACAGGCDVCDAIPGTCSIVPAGQPSESPSCAPFLCGGSAACPVACATSADCIPKTTCAPDGLCKPANGEPCATSDQCASGHCADGVCCDAACSSGCDVCDAIPGTCSPIPAGSAGASPPCSPYLCDGASGECPSACADDTDCDAGTYCAAGGECAPQKEQGSTCSDADCAGPGCALCSGGTTCVDGYCCDATCEGQCAACDVLGKEGSCSPVPQGEGPRGERPLCSGAPGSTCAGHCDGAEVTACAYPVGITCATSCADAVEIVSLCDSEGACVAGAPHPCSGGFGCAGAAGCATACATSEGCAAGYVCGPDSTCAPAGQCDGDHTIVDEDGAPLDCAPYGCTPEGMCTDVCASAADCASAAECKDGRCEPRALTTDDAGCGCQTPGRASGPAWPFGLSLLVAALGLSRHRKTTRSGGPVWSLPR
jgi:hypothetical protein